MSTKIKTVAIASAQNPREMKSWSGSPAHIGLAFEDAGIEAVQGGPLTAKEPSYYRWLRSGYSRLGLGWFLADVEPKILSQRARALQTILEKSAAEAVVSIQPDPIAAIPPSVPTALVHDCTFALLVDYYRQFTGLTERSVRLGHQAYRQALRHASVSIFSSEWAARSALSDYGADPAKVHVVEFGANLQHPPSRQQVAGFVETRLSTREHRFLFAHEAAQRGRVVESILGRRVRERKSVLHEVQPQHDPQTHRRTLHLDLRIVRLNQRQKLSPRHHCVHLFQKLLLPRLLRKPLKLCLLGQTHLTHP